MYIYIYTSYIHIYIHILTEYRQYIARIHQWMDWEPIFADGGAWHHGLPAQ